MLSLSPPLPSAKAMLNAIFLGLLSGVIFMLLIVYVTPCVL